MPKINTHLHLALKLLEISNINDVNAFLLGNAYPDCWSISFEKSLEYHYKETVESLCNLEKFRQKEEINDFNLGYYFHLWVDNRILTKDVGNISKYDCMICDMPVIAPIIEKFRAYEPVNREYQSVQNILQLESEPMPLYLVSKEKNIRYNSILDDLVHQFASEHCNRK